MPSVLQRVEPLTHQQRWTTMIGLGRESLTNADVAAQLSQLADSDVHYERFLALMAVYGSHDEAMMVRFLIDPSDSLSRLIISEAASHASDGVLADALISLAPTRRLRVMKAIAAKGRHGVIDSIHPTLRGRAATDALSFTSDDYLSAHLDDDTLSTFDTVHWRRIAARLPERTSEILQRSLAQHSSVSWVIQQAVVVALTALVRTAPDKGKALLLSAAQLMDLRQLPVDRYLALFPDMASDLASTRSNVGQIHMPASALRSLGAEELKTLVESNFLSMSLADFRELTPAQRASVHGEIGEARRRSNGTLPSDYVDTLPAEYREPEARLALTSPLLADSPSVQAEYLACLDFAEALPLARSFLDQPKGELRAQAVGALVMTARWCNDSISPVLDFCLKRKNEQDPVHLAMMHALSSLPPSRWRPEHLPTLREIVQAMLNARDKSRQTINAATLLVLKMTPYHPQFVADVLPSLVSSGTVLGSFNLADRVNDAQMSQIASSLVSLLQTWVRRGQSRLVCDLIARFGQHSASVPQFIGLLCEITRDKKAEVAARGLNTLIQIKAGDVVKTLIPQLVAKDNSWVLNPTVAHFLTTQRQDLLTPFLAPRVYKGCFPTSGKKRFPLFESAFIRWTASQQRAYAQCQTVILTTPHRTWSEQVNAVTCLSVLPSTSIAPLVELASSETKDAALRELAVEGLGRVDSGQGVPTLIAALQDDRARVAIYSLRRAIVSMPDSQALSILTQAAHQKVTVEKEIVRLIGEFDSDDSFDYLMTRMKEHPHRDVEIALCRALWNHLDRPEAWDAIDEASRRDLVIARGTIAISVTGLTKMGQDRLQRHFVELLRTGDPWTCRSVLHRLREVPLGLLTPDLRDAVAVFLNDGEPYLRTYAARILLMGIDDSHEAATILSTASSALALSSVVDSFRDLCFPYTFAYTQFQVDVAQQIIDLVSRGHNKIGVIATLATVVLPPDDWATVLTNLAARNLIHPGVAASVKTRLDSLASAGQRHDLLNAEHVLSTNPSDVLRVIGLRLLEKTAQRFGWGDSERTKLNDYRKDASPWVAEEAALIESPRRVEDVKMTTSTN